MANIIQTGRSIGILGGGQLGRLLALAAGKMGYQTHIYCPTENCPASQVATRHTCAPYDDFEALDRFARAIDVATFEFENVPASTANRLSKHVPVRPSWKALEIAQDRIKEKEFFSSLGAATAPWKPINSLEDLSAAIESISAPAILKTARLGYDGKGQIKIDDPSQAPQAWDAITTGQNIADQQGPFAILEGFVQFSCEVSVIAARSIDGSVRCFDPVENVHRNHILHTTTVPANISPATAQDATRVAENVASALELVGIVAVEMFSSPDGGIVINEMAPRPHNSGHWTLDACQTDQFTQLVRVICGLPAADPNRHSNAVMTNLLGNEIENLDRFYSDSANHVYVYGKTEAREGRKMGHVTTLSSKP